MYDLWYLIGTGIMFPSMFDDQLITQAKSCFIQVKQHIAPANATDVLSIPATFTVSSGLTAGFDMEFAGYVNEDTIADFRQALADAVKSTQNRNGDPPPPISLYSAAKVSQWSSIPEIDCQTRLAQANRAFQATPQRDPGVFSSGCRALLGVTFIDPRLPAEFVGNTSTANSIAAEFHIHSQERSVINYFARRITPYSVSPATPQSPGQPQLAPALIDRTNQAGWQGCPEIILVWRATGMLL